MHKKILKTHLASLVREKMALSRTRLDYKAWARGEGGEKRRVPDGYEVFKTLQPIDARRDHVKRWIREHHLALGLLRGRKYREMERHVAEGNEPNVAAIYNVLYMHLPVQHLVVTDGAGKAVRDAKGHLSYDVNPWLDGVKYSKEYITAWLSEAPVALQEAAE
jgi:hypothetical protein